MKVRVVNEEYSGLKVGDVYEIADTRTIGNIGPFVPTVEGTILLKDGPKSDGYDTWYSWHHFEEVKLAVCEKCGKEFESSNVLKELFGSEIVAQSSTLCDKCYRAETTERHARSFDAVGKLMGKCNESDIGKAWDSLSLEQRVDVIRKATTGTVGLPGALQQRFAKHL